MLLARNRENADRWTDGEQTQRHRKTNVGVKCNCKNEVKRKTQKGKLKTKMLFINFTIIY